MVVARNMRASSCMQVAEQRMEQLSKMTGVFYLRLFAFICGKITYQ